MKVVLLFVMVAFACAEPPRYQFGRQTAEQPSEGYAPSGWKPQGARLVLPSRQQQPPQEYGPPATYGPPPAPKPSYGPPPAPEPAPEYGPPEPTEETPTTTEENTEPIEPTTSEAESFKVQPLKQQKAQKQRAEDVQKGHYYLLLPDGRLQQVMYVTSADLKNMGLTARLTYQEVKPIQGPIFSGTLNAPFVPLNVNA